MAYQLSFWEVVKTFFIPVDQVFYLFLVIALLGIGISFIPFLLTLRMGRPFQKIYLLPGALVILVMLGAIVVISLLHAGSGWRFEGKNILIKVKPGAPEIVELNKTHVALVKSNSSWQPVQRLNGLGLRGLSVGRFKFSNGKKALYFQHLDSPYKVVVMTGDRVFVLVHPGVDKLYRELIRRGAQPIKL